MRLKFILPATILFTSLYSLAHSQGTPLKLWYQQPAQRWPNNEANAKGRAHQPEVLRPLFGRSEQILSLGRQTRPRFK